jgi:hypothetical protein
MLQMLHFMNSFGKYVKRSILLIISLVVLSGFAKDVTSQTKQNIERIQSVINLQIKAMARDDWEEAFRYASLEIRSSIGSSESFKNMVLSKYGIVYRPRIVSFKNIRLFKGNPAQKVYMVDSNGKTAIVIYFMLMQKDKSWLINGVQLFPAKGISA